jgi:adenylate kinase family enzyme
MIKEEMLEQLMSAKKINIFGCPGAGKSTFARILGRILNLDVYYLDTIYWKPNWVSLPLDQFKEEIKKISLKEQWIIEGNYSKTLNERLTYSSFNIYLNINKWTCLFSAIKRYFKYKHKSRVDITRGCDETLDKEFITFIWHYKKNYQRENLQILEQIGIPYLVISSRHQLKVLLKKVNSCKNKNM